MQTVYLIFISYMSLDLRPYIMFRSNPITPVLLNSGSGWGGDGFMILGLINNIRAYKLGNPSPALEILRKRPFIVKILCSSFFVSCLYFASKSNIFKGQYHEKIYFPSTRALHIQACFASYYIISFLIILEQDQHFPDCHCTLHMPWRHNWLISFVRASNSIWAVEITAWEMPEMLLSWSRRRHSPKFRSMERKL